MAGVNSNELMRERWAAIKGDVQKTWSRLSDEDLDRIDGDFTALEGLLRQKYGMSPADIQTIKVRAKLEELTADFRRDLKQGAEAEVAKKSSLDQEHKKEGIRGALRDQYRQF